MQQKTLVCSGPVVQGMMCAMGRPRTGKRSATAHTTLSERERADFDRLVAAINAELQVEMTDAAVLRMLINRAVKDRGLDAPPKSSHLTPSSKPAPEPTGSRGRGGAPAKPEPRDRASPHGSRMRGMAPEGQGITPGAQDAGPRSKKAASGERTRRKGGKGSGT